METLGMLTILLGLLLSMVTSVMSVGSATVINQCSYEVSCALVNGADPNDSTPSVPAGPEFTVVGSDGFPGPTYRDDNVGQVIMCAKTSDIASEDIGLVQKSLLEWTYNGADGVLNWDASLVDGNPFFDDGFFIQNTNVGFSQPPPSEPSEWYKCWDTNCVAGKTCSSDQVYTNPNDDRNITDNPMRACPPEDNLVWYICT